MFRRHRQRKAFRAEMAAAVAAVRPGINEAMAEAEAVLDASASELASMPGAAARCPDCEGRMHLRRIRGRRRWRTMWFCGRCGRTYRPAEFPKQARAAGWR